MYAIRFRKTLAFPHGVRADRRVAPVRGGRDVARGSGQRGGFSRSLLPARAGSGPAPHGRAQVTRNGGQTGKGGEGSPPFSFLEARHDKTRPTCSGTGCSVVGAPSVALRVFLLNGVFGHKPGDGGDGDQRPVRIGDADVIGPQIPA